MVDSLKVKANRPNSLSFEPKDYVVQAKPVKKGLEAFHDEIKPYLEEGSSENELLLEHMREKAIAFVKNVSLSKVAGRSLSVELDLGPKQKAVQEYLISKPIETPVIDSTQQAIKNSVKALAPVNSSAHSLYNQVIGRSTQLIEEDPEPALTQGQKLIQHSHKTQPIENAKPVLTPKQIAAENFAKGLTHANLHAKVDELFSRVFGQMWTGLTTAQKTKMLHTLLHNSANANLADLMKNSFVNYLLKGGEILLKLGAAGLGLTTATAAIGSVVDVTSKACEITGGLISNNENSEQTGVKHDYDTHGNQVEGQRDLARKQGQQIDELNQKRKERADSEAALARSIGEMGR